jgi:hypothetical protein
LDRELIINSLRIKKLTFKLKNELIERFIEKFTTDMETSERIAKKNNILKNLLSIYINGIALAASINIQKMAPRIVVIATHSFVLLLSHKSTSIAQKSCALIAFCISITWHTIDTQTKNIFTNFTWMHPYRMMDNRQEDWIEAHDDGF